MTRRSPEPPRALRLSFEYRNDAVRLLGVMPVEARALPSDPLEGYDGMSGFWFELWDAQQRVIYRRVIQNPLQRSVEIPDPLGERHGARRIETIERIGVFDVLVPALPDARMVFLVASPAQPRAAAQPARVIARFAL